MERQLINPFRTHLIALALLLVLGFLPYLSYSHNPVLKVRLFSGQQVIKLNLTTTKGSFSLKTGGKTLATLPLKSICTITNENGKLKFEKAGKHVASATVITIEPGSSNAILTFRTGPAESSYEGAFTLKAVNGGIQVINRIELERYVAGVAESEGGDARNVEFYKLQCLITRTYAVKNLRKHEAEGYHFCDQVHCQHYKGRGRYMEIIAACDATRGKVIVDSGGRLINAAFHANSGGETVPSEQVWSYSETYLKAITDTFSLSMTKTTWEKTYKTSEYLKILQDKYSYPVDKPVMRDSALQFTQPMRKLNHPGGISLKTMRNDLELRSTYFSVEEKGDSVVLKGKGFGHGIGLSQEGALRMARMGYTSDQILNYYYRNVRITSLLPGMIQKKP